MTEQIKRELKELKDELGPLRSTDPKLEKLAKDVDQALIQTEETPHSLLHSLQHTAEEFEVLHPQLTAVINNVMTSLGNLGI